MKKIVLASFLMLSAVAGMAQSNLQLHYDFGRNVYPDEQAERPKVTGTFEQFSADGLGSWFYFIDMDFYNDGAAGAYVELTREFSIGKKGFAAHIEYDGGLCSKKSYSARYQQAALLGGAYNGHSKNFKTTYSLQVMYKQFFKSATNGAFPSCQLTGIWSTTFANDALTFAGVFDFWRDEQANGHGKLVFISEPQLWFNLNSIKGLKKCPISIGTEMEFYSGFYSDNSKMYWNPTIAVKCKL
ncbi:MAG: DUF5020 family protein [Bacteroidales bacterium]|nr:DUF5020 family protein [Bacteroidales bacterium]MCM1147924.1 DUF5020 family protein [Bacteroidales bacterium]MCM1205473.1 DUF5020 family protein [Bacillota bacterium]MCM1509265.1 DUF5020 family protein [Clostridium sp.]